jgi:hypothetical protein
MQTGHSQCGTREGGMLNPYSPGGTPCATPPPTTFVEDAYWQPIMAGVGTVEACRRVRITENQFEPPRFSSEALLLEGGRLVRATKARRSTSRPRQPRLSHTEIVEIIAAQDRHCAGVGDHAAAW